MYCFSPIIFISQIHLLILIMKINKVYIASPLYNPKERELNDDIAKVLEDDGFQTYNPQRDGLLLMDIARGIEKKGVDLSKAKIIASKLIFHVELYEVSEGCDATVVNLEGRVPEDGSIVEAVTSFCTGNPLVAYKNDFRSLIEGIDNPMVSGLTMFEVVTNISDIPKKLRELEKRFEDSGESDYTRVMRTAEQIISEFRPGNLDNLVELGLKYFKK